MPNSTYVSTFNLRFNPWGFQRNSASLWLLWGTRRGWLLRIDACFPVIRLTRKYITYNRAPYFSTISKNIKIHTSVHCIQNQNSHVFWKHNWWLACWHVKIVKLSEIWNLSPSNAIQQCNPGSDDARPFRYSVVLCTFQLWSWRRTGRVVNLELRNVWPTLGWTPGAPCMEYLPTFGLNLW